MDKCPSHCIQGLQIVIVAAEKPILHATEVKSFILLHRSKVLAKSGK